MIPPKRKTQMALLLATILQAEQIHRITEVATTRITTTVTVITRTAAIQPISSNLSLSTIVARLVQIATLANSTNR